MLNQAVAAVRILKDITIVTPVATVTATGGPALVVAAGVAIAIVLISYGWFKVRMRVRGDWRSVKPGVRLPGV